MMHHTQTITRRTIKRVESRLKGLGDWVDYLGPYGSNAPGGTTGTTLPPIGGTSTNGQIEWQDFLKFLRGGQLKIDATQFVEAMNRVFYGMEPGCTNPVPNIPVVANNSAPKFCASSIAGMIERCRLTEANMTLSSVNTQFQSRMNNQSDPMAPYIKRWWDQYGATNVSSLTAIIAGGAATCGVIGSIPKLCTSPQVWSATQFKCVYPTEPGQSGGVTTIMMFAVLGFAALMMMRR